MTNHWIDIQHSDVILSIGSNPAENHPISFKYIEKAMDNGGKLISVDPRYTRTSSKADTYAQLRPGTDIAFMGGLINYVLQNNLMLNFGEPLLKNIQMLKQLIKVKIFLIGLISKIHLFSV